MSCSHRTKYLNVVEFWTKRVWAIMSLCEPKNSQNFHHSPFNLVWVYILWLCVQFKESESFEFEQFSVPTEDTCHHFIADYKRKVHHCPKVSWNKDSWSKEQNFNFILTSINVNNLLINPHVHAILPVHATSCNPSVLFNLINPLFYGWTDRNDHFFQVTSLRNYMEKDN